MKAVTDCSDTELRELVEAAQGRPFQARQLAHWVFKHGAPSWDACRNLPAALVRGLAGRLAVTSTRLSQCQAAADQTLKLLLELHDGEMVEVVLIPEGERNTLCISTQVGCPVGCIFCASGLLGVRRNLSTGEIVEQVLHARRQLPEGRRLTNLVVMGIGEPMLNLDQLLPALERIHDPKGINLGARRITVSTSGYPDRIARLAEAPQAYGLAISLHAADDRLRRRLIPTARCTVDELLAAAGHYFRNTGRRVTFEVVLLAEVNDRPMDADALAQKLRDLPHQVNLLPWNPVEEIPDLRRPSPRRVTAFLRRLRAAGLNATLRKQRGADRSAACGQLRIAAGSSS